MAKLKINPLGTHIEIEHGTQTVSELVTQFLAHTKLPLDEKIKAGVVVYMNGKELDSCFWDHLVPSESEDVLISFKLKGGDFGQTFKAVAILAVAIVLNAYAPGTGSAWYATAGYIAFSAAVLYGTTVLLNSLIPPLAPEGYGGFGGGGTGDYSRSQMYSINAQSNQLKMYGPVPKIYGTHRSFPNIGASPYTELSPGPDGKLAQYFYCIYDFGLGPNVVRDIRIGDTPIESYNEVSFAILDYNKPDISEGIWDDVAKKTPTWYRGIRNLDTFNLPLNGARDEGDLISSYRLERNSDDNPAQQEIKITARTPSMYSLGTNGAYGHRYVKFEVSYKMEGEDFWRGFGAAGEAVLVQHGNVTTQTTTQPISLPSSFIDSSRVLIFQEMEGTSGLDLPEGWTEFDPNAVDPLKTGGYYENFGLLSTTTNYHTADRLAAYEDVLVFGNLHCKGIGTSDGYWDDPNDEYVYYGYWDNIVGSIQGNSRVYSRVKYWNSVLADWSYIYPDTAFSTVFPDLAGRITRTSNYGGEIIMSGNSQDPQFCSISFRPVLPGRCLVRIDRVANWGDYSYAIQDDVTIDSLLTTIDSNPILTDKRHTFLEIKIRATDQLNGTIQNLTAVCSSVLDVWNGTAWVKEESNNPAWIYCDILTGQINKKAIQKDQLDMVSIAAWASYCDEVPTPPTGKTYSFKRYEQNFIMDYSSTVQSLISQVTNSCQAGLNIADGKYGVIIDRLKTVPCQIFTPRNYSNFSSSRTMVTPPHGIKVKFIDRTLNWAVSEMIVYFDGYDADTATEFEEVETFGITNQEQAYRYGRYMMSQLLLRRETITIDVDFEHLVCTRGDYVQITSDVMKAGGHPARVHSIVGQDIVIDDGFEIDPLENYSFIFRSVSGIKSGTIDMTGSDEGTILSGDLPSEGDLIVISESLTQTFDCIVKTIAPSDNLKASLVLVEKADGIYTAESESTFPVYDPNFSVSQSMISLTPDVVITPEVTENTWECFGGRYQYFANLSWGNPVNSIFERFEIYVNYGLGYSLAGITQASTYKYIFDSARLGVVHSFKVLAVSVTGLKLPLSDAETFTATPTLKSTRPSDVQRIDLNITTESMTIEWQRINDCDADEYLIRYSTEVDAIWEGSIPLARVDSNTSSITTQARTGTYLIKAVDWNGTESEIAAKSSTTIPELFNLNIIEETNDFPAVPGVLEQCVSDGTSVILEEKTFGGVGINEYYSEGYYYYQNFLDLGDIYTVRLQSLIRAEGFTKEDLMINWTTLDMVTSLSNSKFNEWDVETQVRCRDSFVSMSSWDLLINVTSLNEGEEGDWGPWRKFTVGDFTGRIFQFRLKLISNKASVSPRVFDGIIRADMPDRQDSYENVAFLSGPNNFVYDTPFKGPGSSPVIQVNQDSMSTGDYYILTNKTLAGFTIQFFDKDNNTISQTADIGVKGYGRKSAKSL